MRKVDENPGIEGVEYADHRESIGEVLKSIDKQLRPHNLEIVEIDDGSDTYSWYIDKRK